MTVTVAYSPLTYNCNGSATAFSVTWPFFLSSDLVVTHITSGGVETVLTITTDYTVSGGRDSTTGLPAVGTVTTVATYAAGVQIRITRATPRTQSTSFTTAGAFPAKTVEAMIDRVHMISEESVAGIADDITGDVMQLNSAGAQNYWDGEGSPVRLPFIEFVEDDAPDTPASGYGRLYAKADGSLNFKNDSGTEFDLSSLASEFGAAGPYTLLGNNTESTDTASALSISDVRSMLGVHLATRTALKAISTTAGSVMLTEAGREGVFVWRTGNYSSLVTTDTAEAVYIASDGTASTSGAWVRETGGELLLDWFGAVGDNSTNDRAALVAAWALHIATGMQIVLGDKTYLIGGGDLTLDIGSAYNRGISIVSKTDGYNAKLQMATGYTLAIESGTSDAFYCTIKGFSVGGNVSGPAFRIGKNDFSDAFNLLNMDVIVNNDSTNAAAEGLRLNHIVNSDIAAVCNGSGDGTGRAALVIRQVSFTDFIGSTGNSEVGMLWESGYCYGNFIRAWDWEFLDTGIKITGSNVLRNTFIGGTIALCDTMFDCTAGDGNVFSNINLDGSATGTNLTGVFIRKFASNVETLQGGSADIAFRLTQSDGQSADFTRNATSAGITNYTANGTIDETTTGATSKWRALIDGVTALTANKTSVDAGVKLTATVDDATTNAVTQVARVTHTTSGTPATGIGVGIEFAAETSAGNIEVGATIEAVATDVTSTSEDFDIHLKSMAGGAAAATRAIVTSTGRLGVGSAVTSPATALHIKDTSGATGLRIETSTYTLDVSYDGTAYVTNYNSGGNISFTQAGAGTISFATNGGNRITADGSGNVTAGAGTLSTSATDGFLYVPTCAGTPTGAPTSKSGYMPIVINTTNNKLYFYSGGAWRDAGP